MGDPRLDEDVPLILLLLLLCIYGWFLWNNNYIH